MKKLAIVAAVVLILILIMKKTGYNLFAPVLSAGPTLPINGAEGGATAPISSGSYQAPLPDAPVIVVGGSADDWAPVSDDTLTPPAQGSFSVTF